MADSYPLSWPIGWPRSPSRGWARFGLHSVAESTKEVLAQLDRMGVRDWDVVISTNVALRRDGLPYSNQAEPPDTGAAVYFRVKGEERVLACDAWNKVAHNLWAIAKHVEALRGQARWGVGTLNQAFAGYAALPAPEPWWRVLEFDDEAQLLDVVRGAYRELVKATHPDVAGGSAEKFQRVQRAWEQAQKALA